jgi:hypothetical protein
MLPQRTIQRSEYGASALAIRSSSDRAARLDSSSKLVSSGPNATSALPSRTCTRASCTDSAAISGKCTRLAPPRGVSRSIVVCTRSSGPISKLRVTLNHGGSPTLA